MHSLQVESPKERLLTPTRSTINLTLQRAHWAGNTMATGSSAQDEAMPKSEREVRTDTPNQTDLNATTQKGDEESAELSKWLENVENPMNWSMTRKYALVILISLTNVTAYASDMLKRSSRLFAELFAGPCVLQHLSQRFQRCSKISTPQVDRYLP